MFSFFRALDPFANSPGIESCLIQGDDQTVAEFIEALWTGTWTDNPDDSDDSIDFLQGISLTFEAVMGTHYLKKNEARSEEEYYLHQKGALDFFILPLIARVIICNNHPTERQNPKNILQKTVGWCLEIFIALPIEIVRFAVAAALTIALIPVVGLVHIAKNIRDCMTAPRSATATCRM